MKTRELELYVAEYFGIRTNLIVPNVYWGFGLNYEADLIVVTRSKCAYEVELKVSRSDLKADAKKKIQHNGNFKGLFFAMPEKIYDESLVPARAGILLVDDDGNVTKHRKAIIDHKKGKLSDKQYLKLLELCAMRVWKCKKLLNETRTNETIF